MKRLLVFVILAVLLWLEVYFTQPWWWHYFVEPIVGTAWKSILSLPYQAQLMLVGTAILVAFAVWFVKKWGLHVLLGTAVLAMVPWISFWLALELSFCCTMLVIIGEAVHRWGHLRRHSS
jgi:hypothetical protein